MRSRASWASGDMALTLFCMRPASFSKTWWAKKRYVPACARSAAAETIFTTLRRKYRSWRKAPSAEAVFKSPAVGRYDPEVQGYGLGAAHPDDLPLLDHPKQLDLHGIGAISPISSRKQGAHRWRPPKSPALRLVGPGVGGPFHDRKARWR